LKGQRRFQPPPGYLSSAEAIKRLGKTLYKYVEQGRIRKLTPDGHKHGFYNEEDVNAILVAEQTFSSATKGGPVHTTEAVFSFATLGDMDELYKCAKKFFSNPASAEIRRGWMRKEPRGHYIVKRINDGAVVAYLYLLALKPEYLADYMLGRLPGRKITPEHIERFEPGRPVQACIINAIGSDPDVPQELRSSYVAMLLRGVKADMGELGKEGIIIPHMYAWSETREGIALCSRLGMVPWQLPRGKRCFFDLDMQASNASIIRDYKRGLAAWQGSQRAEGPTIEPTLHRAGDITIKIKADVPQDLAGLPEGTLHIQEYARELGIHRRTLLDQIRAHDWPHIAIDKPGRPNEKERYFTPEQQEYIRKQRAK
jgi:hypothetical protein